jgi:hypothetical protein
MSTEGRARGGPAGSSETESLPKFEKVRSRDGQWYLACGEVITFLFEYLEEDLARERRAEFDRHLSICPSCRSYLSTYRESLLLLRHSEQLEEAEKLGANAEPPADHPCETADPALQSLPPARAGQKSWARIGHRIHQFFPGFHIRLACGFEIEFLDEIITDTCTLQQERHFVEHIACSHGYNSFLFHITE